MARRLHRIERTQLIARPLDEVFAFFADASNLEVITPDFLRFRICTPLPIEMRPGARIEYRLSLFGLPLRWRTRIDVWEPGGRFVDEQESGPYAVWRHLHEFERRGASTLMRDVIAYAVPFGPLGELARLLFVERALRRIFDHRQDAVHELLERGGAPAALGGASPS